jgi:hypothetical protein
MVRPDGIPEPHAEPKFPIVVNEATLTIQVGSEAFDTPQLWRRPEWDYAIKEKIVRRPIDISPADLKAIHKFYCEQLGPKFNRRFQAANYWLWIGNRMSATVGNMMRFGKKSWRVYDPSLVQKASAMLPYIKEAEADGLLNLVPAIVVFQAHPSAIRKEIGGAAWKQIAHGSKTRNMRIMQVASGAPEHFLRLLDYPSGVLNAATFFDDDEALAARLAPKKTPHGLNLAYSTITDTRRMIGRINPEWGWRRLLREHEIAVRNLRQKKFSDKRFAADWSHASKKFTATLLTNMLDIAVEGDMQHHCVGSYAGEAAGGKYAVVRVEGADRATVGLFRDKHGWQLDQVYAACNGPVSADCRAFAFEVAQKLTQERAGKLAA